MKKIKEVLEVKEQDNLSTAIGKGLLSEGYKYAVAFGVIGGLFIVAGKIQDKKVKEVQEEGAE